MKTLYESILDDEDVLIQKHKESVILHEVKNLVNKLGEDTQDYSFEKYKFFKKNDFLLDSKQIEKIAKIMVQNIPNGKPGRSGIKSLKYQLDYGIERFRAIGSEKSISYSLIVKYGTTWGASSEVEYIIYIDENATYVLDTKETKDILDKMDEFFDGYTLVDSITYKYTSSKMMNQKSICKANYRRYEYVNMKKMFNS